jgi:hypothetical protein
VLHCFTARLFTTVRDSMGLTYDVSFELNLFDKLDLGWYVIAVTSTPSKVFWSYWIQVFSVLPTSDFFFRAIHLTIIISRSIKLLMLAKVFWEDYIVAELWKGSSTGLVELCLSFSFCSSYHRTSTCRIGVLMDLCCQYNNITFGHINFLCNCFNTFLVEIWIQILKIKSCIS